MGKKRKTESFEKKDPVFKGYKVFDGCAYSFIGLIILGLIIYALYIFIVDNIPENTLFTLKIIGISLLALFATYIAYKLCKFVYYVGYNIFLFIDKKFSIVEKYQKIISSPKTKQTQTQDYINSLQKEIEELKHKLAELQNVSDITDEDFRERTVADSGIAAGSDGDYIIRGAEVAVKEGQISTTLLQRKLRLGYARASRIVDKLEEMGVIGASEGAMPRKVLIDRSQYEKLVQEYLEHEKSLYNLTHGENEKLEQRVIEHSDPLIPEAVEFAVKNKQLSILMLQERFKLGYARASHIMKELKELGIVNADEQSNVMISKEDYDNISFQKKSENFSNKMTHDEVMELPEYKVLKEYISKLKVIELRNFVNELSPFDYNKTVNILGALMADGTLTEYTQGHYIYAEYDAVLSFVDSMSDNGIEFERFTSELLVKNGFTNIKLTQSSGDYGIDVLAEKDSVTYAIQCKCYSKPVGNKAVQEVYSGKDFYRCMVAVVFTNNYFTKSAIETAKQNNVILWDRNKLIEFIKPLQNSNHINDESYKGHFSRLLKEMGVDIITNYSFHNILLKIEEIYPDDNGVLWELEVQNIDDIANIRLYTDELQKKLNTEVTLKEPLEYPKVCIYVNYSENLRNAYNNFKLI